MSGTCTYFIPEDDVVVDGQGNYAMVKPGDNLCLLPGTRPNIKFMNLHGTEQEPVIIRNVGGKTIITGTLFLTGGIGVYNSTHLRITGTGVASRCGAAYPADKQDCGIEITRTHKGIKLDTAQGTLENIELDHIAIDKTRSINRNIETRGISLHPRQGQVISGVAVHHNYISGTYGEGLYLGSEPDPEIPFEDLGKLENLDVSYNRVENTRYDGINIKIAVRNVKVHHNVVSNTGSLRNPAQQGGIKLAKSVGDVYNNLVIANYSGIQNGRPLENPRTRYFNNVVVGAQTVGIEVMEANAQVYNNTVVDSGKLGIRAPGSQTRVFDNIIAGTAGIPVEAPDGDTSNNYIASTKQVKFMSPTAEDFRLGSGSPAIDAGGSLGVFPPFDFRGILRPHGDQPDIGAFEFTGSGSSDSSVR